MGSGSGETNSLGVGSGVGLGVGANNLLGVTLGVDLFFNAFILWNNKAVVHYT
jgi:hypothetical protein